MCDDIPGQWRARLSVGTRLDRSECLVTTREPAKWTASLYNDHIAWQGHDHITDPGETESNSNSHQNVCNRTSVSSLGCCSVHGDSPDKSWRAELWNPSFSLVRYVAERGRSLEDYRTRDFTFGAQDADENDDSFRPSSSLRITTKFTHPHCPIDWPSEVIRAYVISGTEHQLYRV